MRSDGVVFCLGLVNNPQYGVPALPAGHVWTEVEIGGDWPVGISSEGILYAWESSGLNLPSPPPGTVCVEVASGDGHGVVRFSDGSLSVFGSLNGHERIPELVPGTSYVELSGYAHDIGARVGPTSTYVTTAPGCAGTRPAARLVPLDTPGIDKVHEVNILDLPQNAAIMVFGWQGTAPQPLGAIGMPGCSRHITADAAALVVGQNGWATYRLPIPNWPALVGVHFHNQAIVLDPGANAAGAVASDAAEGVIGHW